MGDEEKKEETKEEKKDDKEEKEEKDGEGKEEGEEDDEDDDMNNGDGEDGGGAFSPQAREWALKHFGDASKARLFQYAEKRTHEDILEMARQRKWHVEVRNVRYLNTDEIGDLFVQFQIGYNFKLRKKYDRPKGRTKVRTYTWVETGTAGIPFLTNVIKNVDTNKEVEFEDKFTATWTGSYFDLYEKRVRTEVWDFNQYSTNNFVAEAEMPLVAVARGNMFQEYDVTALIKEPGQARKQKKTVGKCTIVFIFQELVDFELKFLNWEARLRTVVFTPQEECEEDEIKYQSLVKFDLNKKGRWFYEAPHLKRVSKTDKQMPGAVTEVTTHYPVRGSMRLHGTRNRVEDSILDVRLMETRFGRRDRLMCECRIPLKGVTTSGYLRSQLGFVYRHQVLLKNGAMEWRSELREAGEIMGQVDVTVPRSLLWKEFAQTGELNPPELRDFAPYNYTYLAVKIVRASGLPAANENGTSDPYITLEWGGQVFSTRVKFETLEPVWNETLYFHVRCYQEFPTVEDISKFPFVTLNVWDYDESGSSEALGSARLYLHRITGSMREEPCTCPQQVLRRMRIKRRASRWSHKLQDVEARTRLFKGRLDLKHDDPNVKGGIMVEAWFRGPTEKTSNIIDIAERDEKRKRTHGDLLMLPHYGPDFEARDAALCHCYTGRDEMGRRRVCDGALLGSKCATLRAFEAQLRVKGAQRAEEVLQMTSTVHSLPTWLADYDHTHTLRLLPSFLNPLVPPKDMFQPLDEEFCKQEEARYKPNTANFVQRFVGAFEFTEGHGVDGEMEADDQRHIRPPSVMLDMRKGDGRDHCLLLCNLFLGIGLDAYVVVGRALRPKPSNPSEVEEVEHLWVMTREDHNACCGESPDDWYSNGGAVQFWEATTATRVALESRWEGADPSTWGRGLLSRRARRAEAEEVAAAVEEPQRPVPLDLAVDLMDEEEVLRLAERADDALVPIDEIFLSEAGTGDGWGRTSQQQIMRRVALQQEHERKEAEAAHLAALEAEAAAMEATPQYKRRMRHIENLNRSKPRAPMPYTAVLAVFNHTNLWVNVQRKRKVPLTAPWEVSYDFQRGEADCAWVPVIHKEAGRGEPVECFYSSRGLTSKLSEDRVEEAQREIVEELEAGLTNVRSAANLATRMAPGLRSCILDVLLAKEQLEGVDRSVRNGWDADAGDWRRDATCLGYRRTLALKQQMLRLAQTCPPGFKFRMVFAKLNVVDSVAVRKAMLSSAAKGTPWCLADVRGTEMFAIAAKVVPYYNGVCTCRVGVMVVYKPAKEE